MGRFIIVEHKAQRAGLHHDLRFTKPKGSMWASFAVRKGVPEKEGVKVLAQRTPDHTTSEALFTGTLKSGYGAGKFKKLDSGQCNILKWDENKIISVEFKGKKFKGIYHLIKMKENSFLLLKGKDYGRK